MSLSPVFRQTTPWVLFAATAVLLGRKTEAILNPQLWAEDGTVFFLEQYEHGASAVFRPYAGYLHLVPRLVALLTDTFFPYSAVPAVYNLSSLVITVLVVASVLSRRLDLPHKPLLALAVVAVPHVTNEVFLNITNIQWILAIALIATILKSEPGPGDPLRLTLRAGDALTVLACGLSGPLVVLLLPLFLRKWLRSRSAHSATVLAAAAAAVSIQLGFFLHEPAGLPEAAPYVTSPTQYAALFGYKILGGLFLGARLAQRIHPFPLAAAYLALLFLLLRTSLRRSPLEVLLYAHVVTLAAVLYKFRTCPAMLIPLENGPRYFYVPYVMIAWSLIVLLGEKASRKSIPAATALVFIAWSSLSSGFHSQLVDQNWRSYSESIGKQDVVIPIHPDGWQIDVRARPERTSEEP